MTNTMSIEEKARHVMQWFCKFGLISEFSTVDDRDSVIGFYTPWFNLHINHLSQVVVSHWSWKKDYVIGSV